ncbi:MAG TPA: sigma factor-like helix-turn-helix DNA-binding protein [Propionibacteriaceae bacterium]|jgi:RNA polymerase sigma-70 factor (ECF subfamily)|nr:sigma factor-like helix-turn-helix DNA-binding protein [Propionibacteriaceae bacterium]
MFFLVCWEELSYAEAAEALAVPVGTVRSRLARVRRRLRIADDQEATDA